jgi:hypothetical protein
MDGKFIREYESVKEASEVFSPNYLSNNFTRLTIAYGYLWCYKGEEETIEARIKTFVFCYDEGYNLIKVFRSKNSCFKDKDCCGRVILERYLDTGKLAPDGHYYYHGPHKFTDDEQNKNQI